MDKDKNFMYYKTGRYKNDHNKYVISINILYQKNILNVINYETMQLSRSIAVIKFDIKITVGFTYVLTYIKKFQIMLFMNA